MTDDNGIGSPLAIQQIPFLIFVRLATVTMRSTFASSEFTTVRSIIALDVKVLQSAVGSFDRSAGERLHGDIEVRHIVGS